MNSPQISLLCLSAAALLLAPLPVRAATEYVEGEVIVTFQNTVTTEAARKVVHGRALRWARHFAGVSARRGRPVALVKEKTRTTAQLMEELRKDPGVESVEPNYLRRISAPPNDARFGELWALQNTGQTVNGTPGTAGADVQYLAAVSLAQPTAGPAVVGVLDTGVDFVHPDLTANMWANPGEIPNNGVDDDGNGYADDYHGFDFVAGNADPSDSGDHGTHVAGTIAATGGNQQGVVGINPRARIMALKVSSNGDTITTSAAIEAIEYATAMKGLGVNIVAFNASYGGGGNSSAESAAIQAAGSAGIVFCAAAGNESTNNDVIATYPASYRLANMIVVAASTQNDALAGFSNFGATKVDLAAPGDNILSTEPSTVSVQVGSSVYATNPLTFATPTTGVTGTIHDCGIGDAGQFPAAVNGNIALIARGTLTFAQKVTNAIAAGARAAIIYNNVSGNFNGTLQTAGGWIPARSLSQANGLAIKAALPSTGAIVVNGNYQYLDGTSMATPQVSGAVAFAAMNFPSDSAAQRVQRILARVDITAGLQGKVVTNGRLNLRRLVDTDGNQLPDWWEAFYFSQSSGVDPDLDADFDGQKNRAEFLAGTLPTDPQSRLQIFSLAPSGDGSGFRLTWSSVPSKVYRVLYTNSLTESWRTDLPNSQMTAASGETSLTYLDTTATGQTERFYRIEIVP